MKTEAVSVVFPMAGQGARFGYKFKPFLNVNGVRFIEAAVEPFVAWRSRIKKMVFVYLKEQDEAESVSEWLQARFGSQFDVHCVVLPEPTSGPGITVLRALQQGHLEGAIVCCDCDHAIGVEPIFEALAQGAPDAIIPTWPLEGEEVRSWSVVVADRTGRALGIAEKSMPPEKGEAFGAIGCTYFQSCARLRKILESGDAANLSQALQFMISVRADVRAIPIKTARFFGDPQRLAKVIPMI